MLGSQYWWGLHITKLLIMNVSSSSHQFCWRKFRLRSCDIYKTLLLDDWFMYWFKCNLLRSTVKSNCWMVFQQACTPTLHSSFYLFVSRVWQLLFYYTNYNLKFWLSDFNKVRGERGEITCQQSILPYRDSYVFHTLGSRNWSLKWWTDV